MRKWHWIVSAAGTLWFLIALVFGTAIGQMDLGFVYATLIVAAAGIFLIFVLLMVLATIAIHEVGHLIAGWMVGFSFTFVQIGPLAWHKLGEKVHFYTSSTGTAIGGGAAMAPPRQATAGRWRLMALGGPVANLAVAALLAWILRAQGLDLGFGGDRDLANEAIYLIFVANLITGLLNLVPLRAGGNYSDGGRILMSFLKSGFAERQGLQESLARTVRAGVRGRDWNSEEVARLLALKDNSAADAAAEIFGYYHALDSGDFGTALKHVEAAHTVACAKNRQLLGVMKSVVVLESAFAQARIAGNPELARARMATVEKRFKLVEGTRLRAEAAIALAEGRYEDAIQLAGESMVRCRALSPPRDSLQAELDWNDAIIAEARARLAATPPPAGGTSLAPPSHPEPVSSPDPSA